MSAVRRKGPTVLYVDDDVDGRSAFALLLTRSGFTVYEVDDGERALHLARELVPDVIVLDLCLPRIDGWAIARLLRTDPRTESIPVLAFSASAYEADRVRAIAAGCDAFIEKPAELRSLLAAVRRLLPADSQLAR